MKKFNAIVLLSVLFISQMPVQRAKAQAAAVAIPVGAAVVILGGIAYYVWYNSQGEEQTVPVAPMLEDPEDEAQWGVFRARDETHCKRLAGGRDSYWEDGKCYIKG